MASYDVESNVFQALADITCPVIKTHFEPSRLTSMASCDVTSNVYQINVI